MSSVLSVAEHLHARALEIARRYKAAEFELIEILQEIESKRVFIALGHASLYNYAVDSLGLSENVAFSLITVARKARQVPELGEQLRQGKITLSKAKRIATVIEPHNQAEWIHKASTLPSRLLEKAVVTARPEEAVRERISYVTGDRVRLEVGLQERDYLNLKRVQDLLSQSRREPVTWGTSIAESASEYLDRNDPVERAKRVQLRKVTKPIEEVKSPVLGSRAVPAAVLHEVNSRDQGLCAHILEDGARCGQSRWVEVHHRIPVSAGGSSTVDNLVTLCSAHHEFAHLLDG